MDIHINFDKNGKIQSTAYLGPLLKLVRGREGIVFKCYHVKLGWSQNSFNTPVGFTLTLNKIHGTRGDFTVEMKSVIIIERGHVSLILKGSILTGILGRGQKRISVSSKASKLRV